jgi:hypothetical protein
MLVHARSRRYGRGWPAKWVHIDDDRYVRPDCDLIADLDEIGAVSAHMKSASGADIEQSLNIFQPDGTLYRAWCCYHDPHVWDHKGPCPSRP